MSDRNIKFNLTPRMNFSSNDLRKSSPNLPFTNNNINNNINNNNIIINENNNNNNNNNESNNNINNNNINVRSKSIPIINQNINQSGIFNTNEISSTSSKDPFLMCDDINFHANNLSHLFNSSNQIIYNNNNNNNINYLNNFSPTRKKEKNKNNNNSNNNINNINNINNNLLSNDSNNFNYYLNSSILAGDYVNYSNDVFDRLAEDNPSKLDLLLSKFSDLNL